MAAAQNPPHRASVQDIRDWRPTYPHLLYPRSRAALQEHEAYSYFLHHRSDMEEMVKTAGLQKDEIVLDLGCGTGWLAQAAAPHCKYVYAVDKDMFWLSFATQDASDNMGIVEREYVKFHADDFLGTRERTCREVLEVVGRCAYANWAYGEPRAASFEDIPIRQFDVIFICWVLHTLSQADQITLLTGIRDTILKPGGRLIIDHTADSHAMRTIELVWGVEDNGEVRDWHTWRREKVGNQAGIKDAKREMKALAQSTGWKVQHMDAFPKAEDYVDVTGQIAQAALRMNPHLDAPTFEALELQRQLRLRSLETDFPQSTDFPTDTKTRVHYGARHKAACVLAVLERAE